MPNTNDKIVENIIIKLSAEANFEKAVEGKKFTNPETGNKVKFQSLPAKEQSKIRSQFESRKQESQQESVEKSIPKIEDIVNNPKQREKNVDGMVKGISNPSFKNTLKKGLKKFVNAKDFENFGKAFKNKDKEGMKKALPGMVKGVAKVVGTIAATALLGIGGAKLVSVIGPSIMATVTTGVSAVGKGLKAVGTTIGDIPSDVSSAYHHRYDPIEYFDPRTKSVHKMQPNSIFGDIMQTNMYLNMATGLYRNVMSLGGSSPQQQQQQMMQQQMQQRQQQYQQYQQQQMMQHMQHQFMMQQRMMQQQQQNQAKKQESEQAKQVKKAKEAKDEFDFDNIIDEVHDLVMKEIEKLKDKDYFEKLLKSSQKNKKETTKEDSK